MLMTCTRICCWNALCNHYTFPCQGHFFQSRSQTRAVIVVTRFYGWIQGCIKKVLSKQKKCNKSANCRTFIGQLPVIYRSIDGRSLSNCRSSIGQLSVVYRTIVGRLSANCRSSIGQLSLVCRPTVTNSRSTGLLRTCFKFYCNKSRKINLMILHSSSLYNFPPLSAWFSANQTAQT